MFRFALPLALAAAGCAPGAGTGQLPAADSQARLDAALAGLSPGEPRRCINSDRVRQTQGFRTSILFVEGDNRKYLSDVGGGCAGLARGDILVTRPITPGQYCEGDFVRTRAQTGGQLTGGCALGAFTPYTAQGGE